jgi:hypothetical protein
VAAIPSNATGYSHRGAICSIQYGVEWQDPKDTSPILALLNQMQAALDPFFGPDLVRASSYSVAFCSCIGIVRVSYAAARPLSAPHSPACPSVSFPPLLQPSYINYMDAQHGPDPMLSYYGANSGRLQEMKARMDPTGYFSAHPLAIPLAAGPLPPVPAPDGGIPPAIGPAALPPAPVPAPAPAPSSSGAMLQGALLSAALALLAAALLH